MDVVTLGFNALVAFTGFLFGFFITFLSKELGMGRLNRQWNVAPVIFAILFLAVQLVIFDSYDGAWGFIITSSVAAGLGVAIGIRYYEIKDAAAQFIKRKKGSA